MVAYEDLSGIGPWTLGFDKLKVVLYGNADRIFLQADFSMLHSTRQCNADSAPCSSVLRS